MPFWIFIQRGLTVRDMTAARQVMKGRNTHTTSASFQLITNMIASVAIRSMKT